MDVWSKVEGPKSKVGRRQKLFNPVRVVELCLYLLFQAGSRGMRSFAFANIFLKICAGVTVETRRWRVSTGRRLNKYFSEDTCRRVPRDTPAACLYKQASEIIFF